MNVHIVPTCGLNIFPVSNVRIDLNPPIMGGGWYNFQVTMNKAVKTNCSYTGVYDAAYALTLGYKYISVVIYTVNGYLSPKCFRTTPTYTYIQYTDT